MKIENFKKADNPEFKTKAYFNLVTKNFRICRCRLVLAPTGRMIVMLPYREYMVKGKKLFETVIEFLDVDYIEAITELAITEYKRGE